MDAQKYAGHLVIMNFPAQDDIRVTAEVLYAYNFESDNEENINADDLSDLSDVFEEVETEPVISGNRSNLNESAISLDDITYDRDLKYVNLPNGGRSKPVILQNNRVLKQVRTIANGASSEANQLDHNADPDIRKRDSERKLVEFDTDHSGKPRDSRTKRSSRGRGRRERPEPSGKSRMEEDNVNDVDIAEREVKSSRRRGLGGQNQRVGRGDDGRNSVLEGQEPRVLKSGRGEARDRTEKVRGKHGDARGLRAEKPGRHEQEHTEPHTVHGHDQHLEREYADYIQAAPFAYSPYVQPVRSGRGHERVHPRAVPYQHPHGREPRYGGGTVQERQQQPKGMQPPHYEPYTNEAAYVYDAYDTPVDHRYARAPPAYPTYHHQPTSAYPQHGLFVPTQHQHQQTRHNYGQERHQPLPPPVPAQEPKLNAKAAEFVPTWMTG